MAITYHQFLYPTPNWMLQFRIQMRVLDEPNQEAALVEVAKRGNVPTTFRKQNKKKVQVGKQTATTHLSKTNQRS